MSSRNAYLAQSDRDRALALTRAMLAAGEEASVSTAEDRMRSVLEDHDLRIDYAVVRDPDTLMPVRGSLQGYRALIAAHLDDVRLIDNQLL